ncbi:MAG: sensor histidine kinase [Bacteroidales bacterium]|nr:sensor histidine kinase [Bacteroidales bacterium]
MKQFNPDNKKILEILIHVMGWGIMFGIPLFFMGREDSNFSFAKYVGFLAIPFSFMAVFYLNYFYLIDKYLFTKQVGKYILSNIFLIGVVCIGLHFWMEMHRPEPDDIQRHKKAADALVFFLRDVTSFLLIAGLSVGIKMTGKWYQTEARRKELETSNAEAELKNLKSQLNPHFLFNTLNNIYALVAVSPQKAQGAIHDLSKLLRYVLYDNNQDFVPIEKEIDFIKNYVELMRIRLSWQVKIETDISLPAHSGILVAPLLFITLIENAFKHGVSNDKPSFISINFHTENGNKIICSVANSSFPKDSKDKSGSGIGLVNLQKRLELLYPGQYTLQNERTDNGYLSVLILNLKKEKV